MNHSSTKSVVSRHNRQLDKEKTLLLKKRIPVAETKFVPMSLVESMKNDKDNTF